MAAANATYFPIKNQAYRLYFWVYWDTNTPGFGGLVSTTWTTPSCTISIDGAGYNAGPTVNQVGTSGQGYIDLTAAQMNGSNISVIVSVANSGANQTPISFNTVSMVEEVGKWSNQAILDPMQLLFNIAQVCGLNRGTFGAQSAQQVQYLNTNGSQVVLSGTINQGQGGNTSSGFS